MLDLIFGVRWTKTTPFGLFSFEFAEIIFCHLIVGSYKEVGFKSVDPRLTDLCLCLSVFNLIVATRATSAWFNFESCTSLDSDALVAAFKLDFAEAIVAFAVESTEFPDAESVGHAERVNDLSSNVARPAQVAICRLRTRQAIRDQACTGLADELFCLFHDALDSIYFALATLGIFCLCCIWSNTYHIVYSLSCLECNLSEEALAFVTLAAPCSHLLPTKYISWFYSFWVEILVSVCAVA